MALTFRHLLISALAFVALALALPGAAAASGDDVLRDCFNNGGDLQGRYTNAELREALRLLAADQDAYSECRDIISGLLARARIAGNGPPGDGDDADEPGKGGGGAGASGGSDSSSSGSVSDADGSAPGEPGSQEEARKRALARADTEQQLGERAFDPRDGALINSNDTSNGLPLPVLLALIALTLLLAAGAVLAVHQRNPAFMGALRRVPFPRRRR